MPPYSAAEACAAPASLPAVTRRAPRRQAVGAVTRNILLLACWVSLPPDAAVFKQTIPTFSPQVAARPPPLRLHGVACDVSGVVSIDQSGRRWQPQCHRALNARP